VTIIKDDQKIPLDLDCGLVTDLIVSRFKSDPVVLEEDWHRCFGRHVRSEGKRYSHELMFDVCAPAKEARDAPAVLTARSSGLPGDGIDELRVFLPKHVMDDVLVSVILPEARRLRQRGEIKDYYFIKYPLPHPHIRFRLFGPADGVTMGLLRKIQRQQQKYLISSVNLVPFEFELDTYGGKAGLASYQACQFAMSRSFLSYQRLKAELGEERHGLLGSDLDVIYLAFFLKRLLLEPAFEDVRTLAGPVRSSGPEYAAFRRELKQLWSKHRKALRTHEGSIGTVWALMNEAFEELSPVWNRSRKKLQVSPAFLVQRLLHIEVFRLSGGEFPLLEAAVYELHELMRTDARLSAPKTQG
jgi:thiopeptide-type bacteriocin biosynthesis protein